MTNLHEKLNTESAHIKLSAAEKRAMRAAIFGAPSPVRMAHSPYLFVSHKWMTAMAAVLVVVFAGGGTAFASQGALPGSPLYAVKTGIIEPVQVALAPTPVAKAAVNAQIAATRVAEAEALAQKGTLDATTSAQLAANFDEHAQSALALADSASSTDAAAAVQIKAQLNASAAVGGAVLAALADRSDNQETKQEAQTFAMRLLAHAGRHEGDTGRTTAVVAVNTATTAAVQGGDGEAPKASAVRTMAAFSATVATSTPQDNQGGQETTIRSGTQAVAASLEARAQDALSAVRAQFAAASSTLDASTTVNIQTSIGGIDALIGGGSSALGSAAYDTAMRDFTQALSQSLRLSALLSAQHSFDHGTIEPLFNSNSHDGGSSNTNSGDSGSPGGSVLHGVLEQL